MFEPREKSYFFLYVYTYLGIHGKITDSRIYLVDKLVTQQYLNLTIIDLYYY